MALSIQDNTSLPEGWTVDANGIPQPPPLNYYGGGASPTGMGYPSRGITPPNAGGTPGGIGGRVGYPGVPGPDIGSRSSMGYPAASSYPSAGSIESGTPGMTLNSAGQDQGILSQIGSWLIPPAEAAGFNPDGTPSTAAPFQRLTPPQAPMPMPVAPAAPAPIAPAPVAKRAPVFTGDNRPPPIGGPEKRGANPAGNVPVSSQRLRDLTWSGSVGPLMPGAPFPRLVPGGGMQNTPVTGGGGDIQPRGPPFPQLTDPGAVATAAPAVVRPAQRRAPAAVPQARAPIQGALAPPAPPAQPDSPFTMVLRPNAPANYGGRGGGGPPLTTALDLSGYRPNAAPPPPAPRSYNLGYGGAGQDQGGGWQVGQPNWNDVRRGRQILGW